MKKELFCVSVLQNNIIIMIMFINAELKTQVADNEAFVAKLIKEKQLKTKKKQIISVGMQFDCTVPLTGMCACVYA